MSQITLEASVREIQGKLVSENPLIIEHAGKTLTFSNEVELRDYIHGAKYDRIGFVVNRGYADKWQFPFSEKDPWQGNAG